ncbi:DUF4055 domain-containing protein [Pseudomonas aeruginosa]|uniref:DUF4055 domain-containing protein n=1 Tax=Pseudomonas aeruginosa TaxID=287 RepID=UPI001E521D2F|nr:DUF4055 domain-containing protein [Pseudomonas aeruginosa]
MSESVCQCCAAVEEMREHWKLIDCIKGGTSAMREAGEAYLPKRQLETREDYEARLRLATLHPAFEETVGAMVGRVFAKPVVIGDDVQQEIADLLTDVDTEGRDLQVFAQDWFRGGLEYGLKFALVEIPQRPEDLPNTRQAEQQAGFRPYGVLIEPGQVLGWKTGKVAGIDSLTQFRFRTCRVEEVDEFTDESVEQIRVIEPHRHRVFEEGKDGWEMVSDTPNTLGFIPLVPYYTARTGFLTAKPPLLELAHLVAKHWWLQSSLDSLVDVACVPILVMTGVDSGDELAIGARSAVKLPREADMKYVEHTGAAIKTAREQLDSLQEEMRQAGAKLVEKSTQVMTAKQSGEESAKETSKLAMMCQGLQDSLVLFLSYFSLALNNRAEGGTVQLQPNLDPDYAPAETMGVLQRMRDGGSLSDQTLFNEAQRRGMLAEDLDWESEQERIRNQEPAI